jgi:hypothetical protein
LFSRKVLTAVSAKLINGAEMIQMSAGKRSRLLKRRRAPSVNGSPCAVRSAKKNAPTRKSHDQLTVIRKEPGRVEPSDAR